MPTVHIQYLPNREYEYLIEKLVHEMPTIVAPQMNIDGRKLHDGGVGEDEIMVEAREFSQFVRNVNHIQVTIIAHAFDERRKRLDEATKIITEGIKEVLRDFDRNVEVGVSLWLVEMGYFTIR